MALVIQGSATPKTSAIVQNRPMIILTVHRSLCYEVNPRGDKPLETSCAWLFSFCYLHFRSQRKLQISTLLQIQIISKIKCQHHPNSSSHGIHISLYHVVLLLRAFQYPLSVNLQGKNTVVKPSRLSHWHLGLGNSESFVNAQGYSNSLPVSQIW